MAKKVELETSFFVTSLAPKVRALAEHIRGHWGIENSQYYILDVTFTEDASRIRSGTAPEISASIRYASQPTGNRSLLEPMMEPSRCCMYAVAKTTDS